MLVVRSRKSVTLMTYKVEMSGPAEDDLDKIIAYITNKLHNKKAAVDFLNEFENRLDSLEGQPKMFPKMTEALFAERGYRYFLVGDYLGAYLVVDEGKTMSIIRVLHCRQDHLQWL